MMKNTLVDLFESSVSRYPNNTFLLEKTGKEFQPTTYSQVKEMVYRLGAGRQSLGVNKGDNMALLSEGRNMWVIGELAMFYAGAVNVPLSIKLEESNDLLFRLCHGDVKFVMVSGTQLKKIRAIKDQLSDVKQIIVFDPQERYEDKEIAIADVFGNKYVGGLSGESYQSFENSYAVSNVEGSSYVGGLLGCWNAYNNFSYNIRRFDIS